MNLNTNKKPLGVQKIPAVLTLVLSAMFLTGIIVCTICDFALSGGWTWSLYPISSILFAWLILAPLTLWGGKGAVVSLLMTTLFVVPYLYSLHSILGNSGLLLPIGIRTAAIGLAAAWMMFALFRILRNRKWIAAAISLLLTIPTALMINLVLFSLTAEPWLDFWDLLSFAIVFCLSMGCLYLHHRAKYASLKENPASLRLSQR